MGTVTEMKTEMEGKDEVREAEKSPARKIWRPWKIKAAEYRAHENPSRAEKFGNSLREPRKALVYEFPNNARVADSTACGISRS